MDNQNNNEEQIHNLEIQLHDPNTNNDDKQIIMNQIINLQYFFNDNQKADCRELFDILKDIEINRYGAMNSDATDTMSAFLYHLETGVSPVW